MVSVPVNVTVSVDAVLVMAKWMPPILPLLAAYPDTESASDGLRLVRTNVAVVRCVLSTSVTVRLGAIVTGVEFAAGVPFGGSVNPLMVLNVTTGASLTGVTLMVSVVATLLAAPSLVMMVTVRGKPDGLSLVLT